MKWRPCWQTMGISFLLTSFIVFGPSRHNPKSVSTPIRGTSLLERDTADTPSNPSAARAWFSRDTPMIRRNQELVEFPNPAMTNVLVLVERYGNSGWLKTGLLEDATLFVCASSQLRLWRSNAAREHKRLSHEIENTDPTFPQGPKEGSTLENEWKGVDRFYQEVFLDRFQTRYGITDPDFVSELMQLEFGNPYPDFRTWAPSKR